MKLFFFLFAFALSAFAGGGKAHEFHVSKCEIDHNLREKALQITLHIFLDDLELSMQAAGTDKQFLCTEKELPTADSVYFAYLRDNFQLKTNSGNPAKYDYIGKEISDDLAAVWTYLEVTDVETLSDLTVRNSIILNVHDDQRNIVQIKGGSGSGYFMLQRGKEEQKVEF